MEQQSFIEALTEHIDAINERDVDRFAGTLARDDVRFVGGDGSVIVGRENAIEAHRGWFSSDDWTFEPQVLWTREEGDLALALTRVDYREKDVQRQFMLLFAFVREPDGWKLLLDQNTPIPGDASE